MGEAKRRGTYEERKSKAELLSAELARNIREKQLARYKAMTPQQRLENALLQQMVHNFLWTGKARGPGK